MGLSFKIISMSSSISVPSFMLLPQNPQFCHYFTPFCWTIWILAAVKLCDEENEGKATLSSFSFIPRKETTKLLKHSFDNYFGHINVR